MSDPEEGGKDMSKNREDSSERTSKKPTSRDREPTDKEKHERQLESIRNVRERTKTSREAQPAQRDRSLGISGPSSGPRSEPSPASIPPSVPSPSEGRTTLENVVTRDETESEREALEERVTRSPDPSDLAKMRRLAEKVYHQGWSRLNTDEQLAFMYHSRFLAYLSDKERERSDVQSTMYRMLGAQGKSLGLETRYTTREMSVVADRFFTQVKTPQNAPELYRRAANTDYFKADRGR